MLLKHPKSSDIAMEILDSIYTESDDSWLLHIRWWNIGRCHEPWCMGVMERKNLSNDKYSEWKPFNGRVQ